MKTFISLFLAFAFSLPLQAQPELTIIESDELDNRLWLDIKITAEGNTIYKGGILTEEKWQSVHREFKNIQASVSKAIRMLPQEDYALVLKFTTNRNTFSHVVSSWKPAFKKYLAKVRAMKNPPFEIIDAVSKENTDSVKVVEVEPVKDTTKVKRVKVQKVESSGSQEKIRLQKLKQGGSAPIRLEKKQ